MMLKRLSLQYLRQAQKDTRDILRICNLTECKLKILPGMYQLINDEVGVSNLREVSIEDLFGKRYYRY